MSWKEVLLCDLCEINVGKTPPRERTEYFGAGEKWVSIADINGEVFISKTKEQVTPVGIRAANMKIVQPNTVLFSFKLSVGKVCITKEPVYTNEAIASLPIRDNKILDTKYLYYVLQAKDFAHLGERAAKGLTLNKAKLNTIKIPLPPFPTQKKIACILDKGDELRRKDQQLLAKYDELLQGIFYQMFGDPVKNEKGWKSKKLKDACFQITDGTHFSPPPKKSGIPYITAKHLKSDGLDFFSDPTYIDQQEHQLIFSRCSPSTGDVLYIKDGATTGLAAINEYEFEFSMLSSLALLKPNPSLLNNYYLVYWLNNPTVKEMYLRKFMAGAAIKRFTLAKINNFEILLPQIGLQEKFGEITRNIFKQKKHLKIQTEKSESLFQSLLQKAFKGELVK
jgi:type I restriction enzyme, S subunit